MLMCECISCIYWKRIILTSASGEIIQTTKRGKCRRHSQQAQISTDHDAHGQAVHQSAFEWPVTSEDDCCGDGEEVNSASK